ncbi:MAG: hypothetical protein EDQ89_08005, partial [Acidobacteria bacterium]
RPRHRRQPGEAGLLASGLAGMALVAALALTGAAGFDAYPRLAIDAGPAVAVTALAIPAVALAPLLGDLLRSRDGGRD